MVIGHVTWWPLTLAEQTNVMLDIKPANGHRMLMQSYPGGIESGTDWYQNDAGMVLTETTIRPDALQCAGHAGRFSGAQGDPIWRQHRRSGANISSTQNNGLYTNEWLIGDAKTNEIAMYELGTNHTQAVAQFEERVVRRNRRLLLGRQQCQRSECAAGIDPDPQGDPEYVPLCPHGSRHGLAGAVSRSIKGKIDEQFGFLAFRTAPLVSASHHGCQGGDRGHGVAHDGVGGDREAQPAGMAAGQEVGSCRG